MKQEYKIYKAENTINGFVYIGATTKSVEERKQDHLKKASNGVGSNFQEAIGTFGPDAFSWEQIDSASDLDDLATKEKNYIKFYNSIEKGYNKDIGGGFRKTIYQYTNWGLLVGEWPSLAWASLSVLGKKKSISNTCLGYTKTYKGFYWSYTLTEPFVIEPDLRKKIVIQSDLEENQIAIFDSVAEASRQTGVSKTCISRCCRGKRKCSGGFIWIYK